MTRIQATGIARANGPTVLSPHCRNIVSLRFGQHELPQVSLTQILRRPAARGTPVEFAVSGAGEIKFFPEPDRDRTLLMVYDTEPVDHAAIAARKFGAAWYGVYLREYEELHRV